MIEGATNKHIPQVCVHNINKHIHQACVQNIHKRIPHWKIALVLTKEIILNLHDQLKKLRIQKCKRNMWIRIHLFTGQIQNLNSDPES